MQGVIPGIIEQSLPNQLRRLGCFIVDDKRYRDVRRFQVIKNGISAERKVQCVGGSHGTDQLFQVFLILGQEFLEL
ncbi:hypothetical protein ES703_19759 [subsurface metagenome]